MSDDFFDDEQELMEEQRGEASPKSSKGASADAAGRGASAPADGRREPPPFWMVLAIAAIALVLGVLIGYLLGTSTAYSALEAMDSAEVQQDYGTSSSDVQEMLPEGHPQLEIEEDGTATVAGSGDAEAQQ